MAMGSGRSRPALGVLAHPAGIHLAILEAGTEHVLEDDGLLAGAARILMVVAVAGLGVNEWQVQLFQDEGWRQCWVGNRSRARKGDGHFLLSAASSLLAHSWLDP